MGSTHTPPTNPSLYTRGSKQPLIRAILDNFYLFWHILHQTDQSTHQNVDIFRREPPQTMGSTQPWPIYPSFYTIGSNRPLLGLFFFFYKFSLFWHSLHHTDQSTHQEVGLFGQEHPKTVGATQPWSINPSLYTRGSKDPCSLALPLILSLSPASLPALQSPPRHSHLDISTLQSTPRHLHISLHIAKHHRLQRSQSETGVGLWHSSFVAITVTAPATPGLLITKIKLVL